ncbi:MAG TPA: hypothetical protein VGM88_29475 [Kofleriaceae bacterium]|jgi:hypothetical protein
MMHSLYQRQAALLRRLHALPAFAPGFDPFDVIGTWVELFDAFPVGDLFDRYADVDAVHPPLDEADFDLAVAASFFARDDAELDHCLWDGAPPSPGRRARFELARIAQHVFYATYLAALAKARGARDDGTPPDDFRAFHDALLDGAPSHAPAQRLRYAKVHAAEGLRLARSPRFREWLVRARD